MHCIVSQIVQDDFSGWKEEKREIRDDMDQIQRWEHKAHDFKICMSLRWLEGRGMMTDIDIMTLISSCIC